MTITGGTALAKDDIDQMVKDAEAYAEEDRSRREQVETRNQADQLVHQTEKVLEEQGEKLADDEKSSIETALADSEGGHRRRSRPTPPRSAPRSTR